MLQQWGKEWKIETITARPREVKTRHTSKAGRAGPKSKATPDRAHTLLFRKQERQTEGVTGIKAQPNKAHFHMLPYRFFQESQTSSQE